MQVRLRDFVMEYDEKGSGIPLLLVHGFPLSRKMWGLQLSGLSSSARVITPDLRGFGDSEYTRGPYSMDMLAGDLHEFLNEIGIREPVILGGLSMGGYISFAFCRLYPERVAGLLLAATRAAPDDEQGKVRREEMAAIALEASPKPIIEDMLPKLMSPKTYQEKPDLVQKVREIMETSTPEGMAGALLGMKDRIDSKATLQQFDKPALVIHGADDQIVPVDEARSMVQSLPEGRLEIFEDAGHMVNMEQSDKFNQVVEEFLKNGKK
jgi:3-oxoadipate enol-lactonase